MASYHKHLDTIPRQENGRMRGVILVGRPGIGKTSCLTGMVQEGDEFATIPMASRTAEDFGVYPVPDKVGVYVDENGREQNLWEIAQPLIEAQLTPFLADRIGDRYGIVLLDDVTLGDPRVQSGLLDMVQFGRIGKFQLGKNVLIAMTGNGVDDGCTAVEWNKALLGRSCLTEYEPDFEKWLELPCNQNIDGSVLGFLKAFPSFFAPSVDDPDHADESGKCPSPRDWTSMGLEMSAKHGGGRNYQPNLLWPTLLSFNNAMLGKKAGVAFHVFQEHLMKYPTGAEVLNDPKKWSRMPVTDRNNAGAAYTVCHSLRQHVVLENEKINENTRMSKKEAREAKHQLANKFCHALIAMMESGNEMGAFGMRYLLSNIESKDPFVAVLSENVFNINNVDPTLENSPLHEVMDEINQTSAALDSR